jgi:hypothetical protein
MRDSQGKGSEITVPEGYPDDERHSEQYKRAHYLCLLDGALVERTTELDILEQQWWVWMLRSSYKTPDASHQ